MDKRLLMPGDLVLGKALLCDVYGEKEMLLRRGRVISSQQLLVINQANQQLDRILAEMPEKRSGTDVPDGLREVSHKIREAIEINPDIALACMLFNQKMDG